MGVCWGWGNREWEWVANLFVFCVVGFFGGVDEEDCVEGGLGEETC